MKARFVGTTSMGFVKNRVYEIRSETKKLQYNGYSIICICIYDKNSDAWCPYKSLEAVMENWNFNII